MDGIQNVSRIPTRKKQDVCPAFRGQIFSQRDGGSVPNGIEIYDGGPEQEMGHCCKEMSADVGAITSDMARNAVIERRTTI